MRLRIQLALVVVGCGCLFWSGCDQAVEFQVDATQRPAGAGAGEWVAKVLVLKGQVAIRTADGTEFAARPEVPLLRSDTIAVASASFAVLQLHNGLLNRVDADQSLRVADLASLDAKASAAPIEQQLTGLLTPQEREQPERIVGWHARLAAAQSVAAQDESDELYKHKSLKQFAQTESDQEPPPSPRPESAIVQPPPPPVDGVLQTPPAKSVALARHSPGVSLGGPRGGLPPAEVEQLAKDGTGALASRDLDLEIRADDYKAAEEVARPAKSEGRKKAMASKVQQEVAIEAKKQEDSTVADRPSRLQTALDLGAKPPAAVGPDRLSLLQALVDTDEFGRCLVELARKRPGLRTLQVDVRVRAGKLIGISIQKQALIQGCLTRRLFGRQIGDASLDGAYRLLVRLR